MPREVPDNARDLLNGLLQKDPLVRMSWDEFFTHPFLSREVLNEVPAEDPLQQISELQHRLKDYSEKLSKANVVAAKLQKDVEEARHREAILRQMHEEDRKNSDKRIKVSCQAPNCENPFANKTSFFFKKKKRTWKNN